MDQKCSDSRDPESSSQASTASVLLGSGARNRQMKPRFLFLKGERNRSLEGGGREGKEARLTPECEDWRKAPALVKAPPNHCLACAPPAGMCPGGRKTDSGRAAPVPPAGLQDAWEQHRSRSLTVVLGKSLMDWMVVATLSTEVKVWKRKVMFIVLIQKRERMRER